MTELDPYLRDEFASLGKRCEPLLIVDDSKAVRSILLRLLARLGVQDVDSAPDARTAFRMLRQRRYRAVLCDVEMPEIDGLKLAKGCQEAGIELPFIMITASLDPRYVARARGRAAGYLLKPFGADALRRKLEEVLPSVPDAVAAEPASQSEAGRITTFRSQQSE
ncbi:response regulator [Alsobacter sp. SYSU BS001988]